MLHDKKFLCIIPARKGSTGVKDKNIRELCGKPLIAWAIDAAKDSGIHDSVVVSTDSTKISDIAMKYGADEVWERPSELATKNAHVMDAIAYHLQEQGGRWDYVQLHHATNPLVTGIDILKAAQFMLRKKADFVISMCPNEAPLGVAGPIPDSGCVKGWFPKNIRCLNRQEITQPYQLDGNIYMGKYCIFRKNLDYWNTYIYAYKMPMSKYCDINDETDFIVAKCRLGERNGTLKSFF